MPCSFSALALPGRRAAFLVAAALAAWIGQAGLLHASEQIVTVKTSSPEDTVAMQTAPHVGDTICELPRGAILKFLSSRSHGPHRFAKVEVLAGDCAGEQGYIPLSAIDPSGESD